MSIIKMRYFSLILIFLLSFLSSCFKENKVVYRIAQDVFYSNNFVGKEKNLQGFTNELFSAIAIKEHLQFEIINVSSDQVMTGLRNERYDAAISTLKPNFENSEYFHFSNPFYQLGSVLILKQDSPYKSLNEMGGKIVGIRAGSSIVFNLDAFPAILIRSYENVSQALQDLNNNRIDGVILEAISAYSFTTGLFAGRLKVVSQPLTNEGFRLIAPYNEDSEKLIELFNLGLQEMMSDGSYSTLLKKWGLFNTAGTAN